MRPEKALLEEIREEERVAKQRAGQGIFSRDGVGEGNGSCSTLAGRALAGVLLSS